MAALVATVAAAQRRSPTQSGSGWSLFGSGIRPSNSSDSENEATHLAKSSGSGRSPVPSRSPSIHIPVIFPDFAGNGELADVGDVGLYSSALSTSPTSAIQARDWLAAQPVDLARLKQWDRLREQLALAAPSADLPVSSSSPLQPSTLPLPPSAAASAPSAAAPSSSAAAGERNGGRAAHPSRRRPPALLVDHRDSVGRTALHYAAGYGQADAVRALVRHGASVDAPDRFGVTPLHWACLKAQASVVEALLAAHADTLLTACAGVFSGKSALDLASAESHSAEVSEALTSALGAALFEQRKVLGRGGFGTVIKAVRRDTKQQVALKAVRIGPQQATAEGGVTALRGARAERDILSRIRHPFVVQVHCVDESLTNP